MSAFAERGAPSSPLTTFVLGDGTTFTRPAYKHLHVCEQPDSRPDDSYDWLTYTDAAGWVLVPRYRITRVEHPQGA